MSITRALSNAMSGLGATARGTEIVAANLANVMMPGYARRELAISPQGMGGNLGGVRVDGVIRAVNASLLSETRLANAAQGEATTRAAFLSRMEGVIGVPGEATALSNALSGFHSALSAASARPEDEIRLAQVLGAATALAGTLNGASAAVQSARTSAEEAIAADVEVLNASLDRVAYLNRRITLIEAEGKDVSSLQDERQQVIDRISSIVPLQEVAREGGKVALFTQAGAVLLDGMAPNHVGFQAAGPLGADHQVSAPLRRLEYDGAELSANQMRLFAGGSLAAHFHVRDVLAPSLQQDLDTLALDLHARLADPLVDPSLGAGQSGLFIDAGQPVDLSALAGLAGRLSVNEAVDPHKGGHLWKLRAGLSATSGEPVSDATLLNAMAGALEAARPTAAPGPFDGNASLASRFGTVMARVSTARVEAESDVAVRNARLSTISSRLMADGVDSDAELQRLLQYEQAYAANARVIRAIDEMINQLLRM